MISFYFGLPGCGKTTLLTSIAFKNSKLISAGRSKYKIIYSNVPLLLDHVVLINFDDIGLYDFQDALILIDEASVYLDNRDWKNFSKVKMAYMMLHRHYKVDFCFFSQSYNGYDSKVRSITENVYYVKRGLIPGITRFYRIPYGIIIPDKKDNAGNKFGEICEGYCRPGLISRLFCPRIVRRRYYKFFDSYCKPLNLKPYNQ